MILPISAIDGGEVFVAALFLAPLAVVCLLVGSKLGRRFYRVLLPLLVDPSRLPVSAPPSASTRPVHRVRVVGAIAIETVVSVAVVGQIIAFDWPRWTIGVMALAWVGGICVHLGLLSARPHGPTR